ncbi:unnamed protein product, partial [Symbiodinium microadriaticum]
MAPSSRARGVLMSSASSRKRKAPEEEEDTSAMESRLEWEAIDREAKQLVRSRLKADAGREVSGYDDVAGEGNADVPEPDEPKQEDSSRKPPEAPLGDDGKISEASGEEEPEEAAEDGEPRPRNRPQKRAGQKKTGAQKRREKAAREKEKEKDEEKDDRWLKLRLQGEEKPRRIDANRIVFYYDFDARGNPRRPVDPDAE